MKAPEKVITAPVDYESLNKFLLGAMAETKRKEIDVDTADAISRLADKVVKNNLTKIMDAKRRSSDTPIDFFEPLENRMLISK